MTPTTWHCVQCGNTQTADTPGPCLNCTGHAFASSLGLDADTVQTILLPHDGPAIPLDPRRPTHE